MYINSEAAIPLVGLAYEFMYMELCKIKVMRLFIKNQLKWKEPKCP